MTITAVTAVSTAMALMVPATVDPTDTLFGDSETNQDTYIQIFM